MRVFTGQSVFEAAVERMETLYRDGHRVVVSFSGGKDSTACLEVCIIAARNTGRLPVEVVMRDEEIMFPGTFEYCERVAQRPEVSFNWIYACQPIINLFNREMPFWWVFDPLLKPEQWVRQPPARAYKINHINIEHMNSPELFPPAPGKGLFSVVGLRGMESRTRLMGVMMSKGYLTAPNKLGVRNARPIYDWEDDDVWLAISRYHWDYNSAYDVMSRLGIPKKQLRIAPPTMSPRGIKALQLSARAWPKWFDKVCERLPGVRLGAKFGKQAIVPVRRLDETWEQCFQRTCIDEAPKWIADRSRTIRELYTHMHARHSKEPLPEVQDCPQCSGKRRCWKGLAESMYNGDCFSQLNGKLPQVEPDFFRPGSGTWGGKASW